MNTGHVEYSHIPNLAEEYIAHNDDYFVWSDILSEVVLTLQLFYIKFL